MEIDGTRAVAFSPRSDLGNQPSGRRPCLAPAFSAVPKITTHGPVKPLGVLLATQPHVLRSPDAESVEALHKLVLSSLDDDQAVETVSIPLAGKSSIADYMVV